MSDYDLFGGYEPEQPATLEEDKPARVPKPPRPKKPRNRRGMYDALAFLFLGGTVGLVVLVVVLALNPGLPFNPFPRGGLQATPTLIQAPGGPAGPGPSGSETPTRIPTALPVAGASTATPPPAVPTGLTALPIFPSPLTTFPFTIQNEAVTYTKHPKGCNGLWLVGQLFNLDKQPLVCGPLGRPLPCLPVQVIGENFSTIQYTGSATQWGPSGYEVFLNSTPIEAEFQAQLLNSNGQPLSEPIVVHTLASCDQNVAVVNFIQIRDFSR